MVPDVNAFIEQSLEGLKAQTAAHTATWQLSEEETWSVDQDTGKITLVFADGRVATADMQIVGTYNTEDGTFLWGWDHPSVEEPLRKHAELARRFGEDHGLPEYSNRMIECAEEDAWEFTAVTVRLAQANGAYCGPAGSTLVYMTFGDVTLSKP